jgi:hypothetical protein
VHDVGGVVLFLCIKFIWNFVMVENISFVFESMGGIDQATFDVNICQPFHSLSNVESVH